MDTCLHMRLNARILTATHPAAVVDAMRRGGSAPAEIERWRSAADVLALAMENVRQEAAKALEKGMAASGGAAVPQPAAAKATDEVGVLLIGSRQVFEALFQRLAEERPPLPAIGQVIRESLEAYGRRRFEIRMGPRRLTVGPKPAIMGVVNVTPDSFSDGGRFLNPQAAVEHAERLAEEGADIIDVGGESTRPGSRPVGEEEELGRVLPVVEALARRGPMPISIDTRHARVAREAMAAGACLVNDVTALQGDPQMAPTVSETGAGVVLMHMQGEPKTMQNHPVYDNLMADVCRFLRRGMHLAQEAGVPEDGVIIDPGFGFGKTLEHNLQILARLGQLQTLGRPILVGLSRKQFIGRLTGVETPADRRLGTLAACVLAVAAGALLVRVHDVREIREALTVAAAVAEPAESAA